MMLNTCIELISQEVRQFVKQRHPVRTFPSPVQNDLAIPPCNVQVLAGVDKPDGRYVSDVVATYVRRQRFKRVLRGGGVVTMAAELGL